MQEVWTGECLMSPTVREMHGFLLSCLVFVAAVHTVCVCLYACFPAASQIFGYILDKYLVSVYSFSNNIYKNSFTVKTLIDKSG